MAEIKFQDNRVQCKNELGDAMIAFLHKIGGEFVSQTARKQQGQNRSDKRFLGLYSV